MRSREFLKEASLAKTTSTSWPGYLLKLKSATNLSLGEKGEGESGLTLSSNSKKIIDKLINDYNAALDKKQAGNIIRNTSVKFTNGSTAKLGSIFKGPELKQGSTQTRSTGLVAEALLGVAMYAKLIARKGDLTAQISANDVWSIVDRIQPQGKDLLSDQVTDINHKVSDNIHLSINLAGDIQHLLTNKQHRPLFAEHVTAWVTYANSDLAQLYADALYKNNRPDNVTIQLAGKEGGKIDVAINVLNAQGQATRKMEQVKLSVKLSDSLIGQAPRGKNVEEVYTNLEELFMPLGVNLSSSKESIIDAALSSGIQNQFIDAMVIAYKIAVEQLEKLAGPTSADIELAERVSKFVDWHATQNDPTIQVLEKTPGSDYRILNYKQLGSVFKKHNIDLIVSYKEGSSSKAPGKEVPMIQIYDANHSGKTGKLLEIRFRWRGDYANTIIEPGPLLKELAAYNRFKSNKSS